MKKVKIPVLDFSPLMKFHSGNEKMVICKAPFCDRPAYESEGGLCFQHQCKIGYIEIEIEED